MKSFYLTILLMLGLVVSASAQKTKYPGYDRLPKDSTTHKVVYTGVVQVPGVGKDELFVRAKEWSARNFGDNKSTERMNDQAAGTLVAKTEWKQPPLSFTDTHSNLYKFTVAVYVKDGRYMYRIDDFTYQNINPALVTKDALGRVGVEEYAKETASKKVDATLKDFDEKMKMIVGSLDKAMKQATPAAAKDW